MLSIILYIDSADESIKCLIQAEYTDYWNDDADYPDVSIIEKSSGFPRPRPTYSSELIASSRLKAHEKVSS
jgi:hypothetical protein